MSAWLPIVTYHSIDDRGTTISTAPDLFAAQARALARAGRRTARVAEIAAALRERRPLPDRTIVITFDDGYVNFADRAWPILRDHGLGATLFAVAPREGGRNDWDRGEGTLEGEPLLDAASLRDLAREGVEIGAHSLTHASLRGIDPALLEREVGGSGAALSEAVGVRVGVFAYPYGANDPTARAAAARHYVAACGTRLAAVGPGSDPYRLERFDAYYLRRASALAGIDSPASRARLAVRGLLRALAGR